MPDSLDEPEQRCTRVLLMAEYIDTPLWNRTPDGPRGPVEYEELGLSEELVERLGAWNSHFSVTAQREDGFTDPADRAAFTHEGWNLVRLLQVELGRDVEVLYGDGFSGPAHEA